MQVLAGQRADGHALLLHAYCSSAGLDAGVAASVLATS